MATATKQDIRALGVLTRHPVCGPRALSEATGIPERTLHNAVEGIVGLGVPNLRLVLLAMRELGQERDALDMLHGLLGLDQLGWEVRPAKREQPAPEALAVSGLQVGAEAGELQAALQAALRDGHVTTDEAAAIQNEARDVERAAQLVAAEARSAPTAQLPILGTRWA